jgi:hypothetical protein
MQRIIQSIPLAAGEPGGPAAHGSILLPRLPTIADIEQIEQAVALLREVAEADAADAHTVPTNSSPLGTPSDLSEGSDDAD